MVTFPPHLEGLQYSECKSIDQKLFSVSLQNKFKEHANEEEKIRILIHYNLVPHS